MDFPRSSALTMFTAATFMRDFFGTHVGALIAQGLNVPSDRSSKRVIGPSLSAVIKC
jgi:hypothetical protein